MITLEVSEVKKFLHNAKAIKRNGVLPILSYILIECKDNVCRMVKNQMAYFLVEEVSADFKKDESILVDETFLTGVVQFTKGTELEISVDKNQVVINDGYRKYNSHTDSPKHYPVFSYSEDAEKVVFDSSVISAIGSAMKHTYQADKDVNDPKSFVFSKVIVGESYVIGVNPASSYFCKLENKIPEFNFDAETVSAISKENSVVFSESEQYYYLQSLNAIYGFKKRETTKIAFDVVMKRISKEPGVLLSKKDLLSFCEFASTIDRPNMPPELEITESKDGIVFKCIDGTGDNGATETLVPQKKDCEIGSILLQPKYIVMALKEVSSDTIMITPNTGFIVLTAPDEPGYMGAIHELTKKL